MSAITGTPSADLIYTDRKALHLIMDCTPYFPDDDKINYILTARFNDFKYLILHFEILLMQ